MHRVWIHVAAGIVLLAAPAWPQGDLDSLDSGACGNGLPEGAEVCDDGNNLGGDGCAANCTEEERHAFSVTSRTRLPTSLFSIPVAIRGQGVTTIGQSRDVNVIGPNGGVLTRPGERPSVIKSGDLSFAPLRVPGLACVCARSVIAEEFGPGNVAAGLVGCGQDGLADVDYVLSVDHNTNDEDPACERGVPDQAHPGVCNGTPTIRFTAGGPRGSAIMRVATAVYLIPDGGRCNIDLSNPAKGSDGIPCSDDDPGWPEGTIHTRTTGTALAEILDADNQPGNLIRTPEESGVPFDCDRLASEPDTGLAGTVLVSASAVLDVPGAGDLATVATFELEDPSPTAACAGDCNADGSVTVNELITGVNIALGSRALDACPPFDANADEIVTVDELITAVNAALGGCPT